MKLYRDFTTQDELDREYNPSTGVPQSQTIIESWNARSEAAIRAPGWQLDVRYGPTRAEYLDILPAGPDAPVHLFIHGGYWRRFSARNHSFLGPAIAALGCTAVIVNYDLCPGVTVTEIVREVRAAIAWTFNNISRFGADPHKLTISGHSAGGHLVGMALASDWEGEYGLPRDIIKGAVPISGLFDLGPFPYTYLQPAIQLTWEQVRRASPILLEPRATGPTIVAVGGAESAEFRRQSMSYVDHLKQGNGPVRYLEIAGRNHFDVLDDFLEPTAALATALREIGATR